MTTSEILTFLKSTPLFANIDLAVLDQLVPQLDSRHLAAGEVLIQEGEPGDELFILQTGGLQVAARNADGVQIALNEIIPGMSVGEIALLTGGKRTATVSATQPSQLLCLSRDHFEQLAARHPLVMEQVTQAIVGRLQQSQLNQAFRVNTLLEGLEEAATEEIRRELDLFLLPSGQDLMQAGDPSDALYFIVNGRLRAVTDKGVMLVDLGRGQTVGEMGLITGAPRSARVFAMRDTLLARLSKASFDKVLANHPEAVMRHFAGAIVRRLQGQIQGEVTVVRDVTTFALLPVASGADLAEFVAQLEQAMMRLGDTVFLNAAKVNDALARSEIAQIGDDHPLNLNLVRWLSDVESQHTYIVYVADPTLTNWTQRCLRQADQILLFADVSTTPTPDRAGPLLANSAAGRQSARRTLILAHPAETLLPQGTGAWLEASDVQAHYHVRTRRQGDFARLARLLTGRGIGLVLSGGGALGFAHVGAIRVLQEVGVPVDVVGGTSAGGLMSAQHAMGWDYETVMRYNHMAANQKFDYTLPITALMNGQALTGVYKKMFGETQIEDLWLPFYCISTNISRSRQVVHERGPVWKYVRSTTSVPGVVPPVMDQGDMLIDGGVLNNLPTDVMRQRADVGTIFALDVSGSMDRSSHRLPAFESHVSGWQVLGTRLNPFAETMHVPTLASTMMRIAMMGNAQSVRVTRGLADFYARIQAGNYSLLEFKAIDEIVDNGYRSTQEAIAEWAQDPKFQALLT